MKKIGLQQRELVDAVIAERDVGGLTAAIIEKDIHVTDALHALDAVCNQHASLVFCGGTSLSKAYAIIERMSEDIDLKVVLSNKICSGLICADTSIGGKLHHQRKNQ
jgi:predicted nucleotidyltransferase component of viral defense system